MRDSEVGVAQNNREQLERAVGLMYETAQQVLASLGSGKKVTQFSVRVPVHRLKLGIPKASVENE